VLETIALMLRGNFWSGGDSVSGLEIYSNQLT